DDLEHLLLVVDQYQRAVVRGPDTEIVRHRFSPLGARMRLRSVRLELARQDPRGPADRGVLRNNGDLALVGFRLALGPGRLRLDQQSRDYSTHGGGGSEGVAGDLEAVGE